MCAVEDSHRATPSRDDKVLHADLSWRFAPEYSSGVFREEFKVVRRKRISAPLIISYRFEALG